MEQTHNLKLPYIMPSQAQKHVTHNEALRMLDAVVQLSVRSTACGEAPEKVENGQRYIVPVDAKGDWRTKSGQIAAYMDDAWYFITPIIGWLAYVEDEAKLVAFDGSNWQPISGKAELIRVQTLGINAEADENNRLTISGAASLFNHDGFGHQIKINKNMAEDTASVLFQTQWTGFAEFGLNGSNDFSVKVGSDAGVWREAIKIDRESGNVAVGELWPETRLHVDGPIRPATYPSDALPDAALHGEGAIISVRRSSGECSLAHSDGANWCIVESVPLANARDL